MSELNLTESVKTVMIKNIEPLNLTWLKGRMYAMEIIAFSMYTTMKLSIKKYTNLSINDTVVIIVENEKDKEALLKKADKLEALKKEIGMEIIIEVSSVG